MDPLSIEIIREELSLKYEKIKRAMGLDEDDSSEKDETVLVSGFQKFKGRCYGCGKFGHKSQLCPDKDKNGMPQGRTVYHPVLCATTARKRVIGRGNALS